MKTLLLTLILSLLLGWTKAQTAIRIQNDGDKITTYIPNSLFKAYTYNRYTITDTTTIITATRDSFDLILRDIKNNRSLTLILPENSSKRIRSQKHYKLQTGQPVILTINTTDRDYALESNLPLMFDFIGTELGTFEKTYNQKACRYFILHKNRSYGLKYISDTPGSENLVLNLLDHNWSILESKTIPITYTKANIQLYTTTSVSDSSFNKVIRYKVHSSVPVLSDIYFSLEMEIKVNGFTEWITMDNLLLKKSFSELSGEIIKEIKGRYPKSFIVKKVNLLLKEYDKNNADYQVLHCNTDTKF